MHYVETEVVRTKVVPPPQYPARLLDLLLETQGCKNDAALCRLLKVAPPVISKIRHGRNRVSGDLLLVMYEKTGQPIDTLLGALYGSEETV